MRQIVAEARSVVDVCIYACQRRSDAGFSNFDSLARRMFHRRFQASESILDGATALAIVDVPALSCTRFWRE
jgi:hypothetical protein